VKEFKNLKKKVEPLVEQKVIDKRSYKAASEIGKNIYKSIINALQGINKITP